MDWKRIKAEYIAGGTSYRKLAEKYGISRSKLQAKATSEKWVDLRGQAQAKTESKIVEMISGQGAENAVNIIDVADKLLKRINTIIDSIDSITGLKDISTAIKNIKEIKGFKSDADMREQEARIRNLEKQAEAEKDANDVKVIIEDGIKEYSN